VWWDHNRDAFLWDLLSVPAPRGPITAAGTHPAQVLGGVAPTALPHAPSPSQVHTEVMPALLARLETEEDGGALAEAVLALGRMTRAPYQQPVTEALIPLLADDDARVAESAAVALGLLGSDDGRDVLYDLSTCSQAGHKLSGRSSVPDSLRITSTLALGLLGDESSSPRLRDLAEGGLNAGSDLRASAILALGVLGPADDDGTAPWLEEWSQDRRLPLNLQVSLATTLGRVQHAGAVAALMDILGDRDADSPTRQAAVASLGQAATLEDGKAVDALIKSYKKSKDAGTRQLALLSLARLATGDAESKGAQGERRDIDKLVRKELRKPSRSLDRPFTALAAGLLLRGRPELRQDMGPILLDAYEDASDPNQRGAYALGLGLAHMADGAEVLRADLEDTRDADLAGHLAVALGLLGDGDAAPLLQERLVASGQSRSVREDLATGLRLMDDGDTLPLLAGAYRDASNGADRAGLAAALGALRHAGGVDPLLSVCADDDLDSSSRASAYAALGRLAETTAAPFGSRFTRDDAPAHALTTVVALAMR
jgi:HEAT repeat protein